MHPERLHQRLRDIQRIRIGGTDGFDANHGRGRWLAGRHVEAGAGDRAHGGVPPGDVVDEPTDLLIGRTLHLGCILLRFVD